MLLPFKAGANIFHMQISSNMKDIVGKVVDGLFLTRKEIVYLLRMNHQSMDAGFIMAANAMNRIAPMGISSRALR